MAGSLNDSQSSTMVQIELPIEKLEALFAKGELCVADIHCLNAASKKSVWRLCLQCCCKFGKSTANVLPYRNKFAERAPHITLVNAETASR